MNFFEKFKSFDKKQLFLVFLIFLLGFGIRAHLMKYGLFFEFDSYYHARLTSYVIQNGFAPALDPQAYYYMGGAPLPNIGGLFWQLNALIYKIFTLGAPYNKELWIWFVKILPAFYGAITAVLMFFLGKEIFGKKAGYAMALIAAVVPAFVYRTMAGFYEPTSFGFMWFVAGAVFFIKATKSLEFSRKTIIYSIVSGILFGLMAFAYGGYLLVPIILALHFVFSFLLIFGKKTTGELLNFVKNFAIVFVLFAIIASIASNFSWINATLSWIGNVAPSNVIFFVGGGAILVLGFISYAMLSSKKPVDDSGETRKTILLISTIALYGTLLVMLAFFLLVPNLFEAGFFGRSVGEENTGKQFFANKFSALIFLPIAALLLIPFRILRSKNETEHSTLLLFFWIFVTLFMAWYKLKFTFTFGLPVAVGAGIVIAELFHFIETKNRKEQFAFAGLMTLGSYFGFATNDSQMAFSLSLIIAAIFTFYLFIIGNESIRRILIAGFFGLTLLTGIAAGMYFVKDNVPNIESSTGWKEALNWIKDSAPKDSKMFNWWDEGHWISFMSERKTFIDNRNLDFTASSDFSKFLIETDINKAVEILKKYNPDYLILSNDMFFKEQSFAVYAFQTDNGSDPRLQGFLGMTIYCSKEQADNSIVFSCGNNRFNESDMMHFYTIWNNNPNQLQGDKIPLFIYKSRDNSQLFISNEKVNNSMLSKIWFTQPEAAKYFEEVYDNPGVKIFKIKLK